MACKPAQPPTANVTNVTIDTSDSAQLGDLVSVNYVITLENGSVADTNNPEIAQAHGLKTYQNGPFRFILGQSGKFAGLDQSVIGMKIGETKEQTIAPTERDAILTLNKTQGMKRSVNLPLKRAFRLDSYESLFGKPPVVGDVIFNSRFAFRYQVVEISNKSVAARAIVTEGNTYQLEGLPWPSKLLSVLKKENIGIFMHAPEINKTFASEFGPATITEITGSRLIVHHEPQLYQFINKSIDINGVPISQQFQVIGLTNDTFTIQRYGLLTDKTVYLKVELLDITKDVKTVRDSSATPLVQQVETSSVEG